MTDEVIDGYEKRYVAYTGLTFVMFMFTKMKRALVTNNKALLVLVILSLFIIFVPFIIIISESKDTTKQNASAAGSMITFTPSKFSLSDPELPNAFRGGYPNGNVMNPSDWPLMDSYDRFDWSDFETAQDVYNWTWMEHRLANAASRGGRWGFRIMAGNSSRGGNSAAVPQYLISQMSKGFWFTYPGSNYQTYAPDWNDPVFFNRAQTMMQAIATKYGNDPRLGWVEIGFYGDWSEWHVWQWPYNNTNYGPSPTGAADMTLENKQNLIDMIINTFPNKQIVMPIDEQGVVAWVMQIYPKVGLRRDCLGYPDFINSNQQPYLSSFQDRWKTAPWITETCYISSGSGGFQQAADQVAQYHIAMISGHNMQSYNSLTSAEQSSLQQAYKTSGYRIAVNNVTLPSAIDAGTNFQVITQWLNTNYTPPYNPWNVMFQLRDSSGSTKWQSKSVVDLQTLLPTGTTPFAATDTFTLPSSLTSGTYNLFIQINNPYSYYKPLNLANIGRQSDGSYLLGQINVTK